MQTQTYGSSKTDTEISAKEEAEEAGENKTGSEITLSNATLYGNYSTGYIGLSSADPFLEGMEYEMINGKELSVLPIQMYCFPEGSIYAGSDENSAYKAILGPEKSAYYCSNMELGLNKEELFRYVATNLCGNEVAEQAISFYEENIKDKMDSAELYFADKQGQSVCVDGYYKVEGSVMDFGYLTVDESGSLGLETMQFDISFLGRDMQISRNGISGTLPPFDFSDGVQRKGISGYASSREDTYMGISVIFLSGAMSDSARQYISIGYEDGYSAVDPVIELSGENTVTISWEKKGIPSGLSYIQAKEDPVTMTFQYLSCGPIGFVLIVDGESYFYQSTRDEYYERRLKDSMMDVAYSDLKEMEDQSLEEMVLTQGKIMEDLKTAFNEAGVLVDIDGQSGKITMRNIILFGFDDAELSEAGKKDLDQFFEIYQSVILNEDSEYYDYIEGILLEGHTDSTGDYDYNKELSLERAIAVDDYCYEKYPALSNYIDTEGCSSDNLVYDKMEMKTARLPGEWSLK